MIILEKPYVSAPLVTYLEENNIPVLSNDMSRQLTAEGHKLNILNDEQFVENYNKTGKLYAVSENALVWLYEQLPDSELVRKIKILKDKAQFRNICSKLYPNFYYKEVNLEELSNIEPDTLPLPVVLKPSVGFLSVGVYIVRSKDEWQQALADIEKNFARQCAVFPTTVVQSERFVIEQFIDGEEYAVDAYYDGDGNPHIINIFHHIFKSPNDVSDRLYCMSKDIFESNYAAFNSFCIDLNGVLGLRNFPMHVEFRVDKNSQRAVPIEVNPLRFAGMCLNDITIHTCHLLPVRAYLEGIHPDYKTMWNGIENDTFSFIVLDKPFDTARPIDFAKLRQHYHGVLETRDIQNPAMSIWGFMFMQTPPAHKNELNEVLHSDLQEYLC